MRTIGFAIALFAFGCIAPMGCKATCAAIDLASKTCPAVVEYVDQYGTKRTTTLTNEDARELVAIKAARRDAGAP